MKSPVGIRVLEQAVLVLVVHPHLLVFLLLRAHEVVGVDEVVARVVRRVDVDHLHLAQIRLLQELEHFEVVALDVEVFGSVPVFALCRTGAQRLADGLVRLYNGRLLSHPGKLVALVPVHHIRGQHLLEHFKIDPVLEPAVLVPHLGDAVGEQRGDFLYVL